MKFAGVIILVILIAIVEWRAKKNGHGQAFKSMQEDLSRNAVTQQRQMSIIESIENDQQPDARDV
jgi:hypothetical protein